MRAAVIVFPGSNCDRDIAEAFRGAGIDVTMVWHKDTDLPAGTDIVGVPGGFSYGDYLRCGAIAARSPVVSAVRRHVGRGGYALGICNGFQILTEAGLLPGALNRNAGLRFVCRTVPLRVTTADSAFTSGWAEGAEISLPVAHHDGSFVADDTLLARLRDTDRIALTYRGAVNGSAGDIAGILSENRRVLGLMPHPERAVDAIHPSQDGAALFRSLAGAFAAA